MPEVADTPAPLDYATPRLPEPAAWRVVLRVARRFGFAVGLCLLANGLAEAMGHADAGALMGTGAALVGLCVPLGNPQKDADR